MEVSLGIDVGTGSTKAGLVDGAGRLLAVGRAFHRPVEPRPGWSETDPATWLNAAGEAVAAALGAMTEPVQVVGVGLSGQMHGVVVCEADARPLRPAVLWADRRSQPDLARLVGALDPDTRARLANPVVAGMAGPSLAALRRLEPDVIDRTRLVLQPKDWLRAQLTGQVATDPSDASATLLWDVQADDWSARAIEAFQVERDWLPPVRPSDTVAGTLTENGGAAVGLAPGLPVAIGAADTAAALLGAGLAPGETQLSTGTGGQLARLTAHPVVDPTGRTHLYRDAGHGWYAMAAIQNAGLAIDWALGLLEAGPDEVEEAMTGSRASGPGAEGVTFLPYLSGERTPHLDPTLTGRWVGVRSATTRASLIRSVFEGVAFALRDGLDALRRAGHPIEWVLLAGGGSVDPWWRQLLSDALELPLFPHDAVDASVRGAGLLGWASVGRYISPAAAVGRADPVEPSPGGPAALAEGRARFSAAGPAMARS